MCDWRLGKQPLVDDEGGKAEIGPDATTQTVMIACLKRIAKSIQGWTKRGGRRGYYEFISQIVK